MWCSFRGSSGSVCADGSDGGGLRDGHLVEQGWASQQEVARAFACAARTVRRHQRRFEEGGLAALGRTGGIPKGAPGWLAHGIAWFKASKPGALASARSHAGWVSMRKPSAISSALGVESRLPGSEPMAFGSNASCQPQPVRFHAGPALSPVGLHARCGPKPVRFLCRHKETSAASHDTDPGDRCADRLLARLGLLEDAPPLFGSATAVPGAGVLLALPVLVASGVFECAQKIYGSLGPAFYGLRTSLLTLLLMALWRIKRPEGLKETRHRTSAVCWGWTGRPK